MKAEIRYLPGQKIKEVRSRKDVDILNEIAKIKGFKGRRVGKKIVEPIEEYAELLAREMGFRGKKKGERIDGKIVKEDMSPITEYAEFLRKRGISPKNIYITLIPEEEFVQGLEDIRKKWLEDHEKFVGFCEMVERDVRGYFEITGSVEAAVKIEDMLKELDIFDKSRTGAMKIYNIDDLIIGLSFCLGKGVTLRMTSDRKHIIFKKE